MSSYHIQDLRLVLPTLDFDLRVNKRCAEINVSFREWLQELLHGDAARVEELSEHRFDLLCSLCFPTIDPPQLLYVSKLSALTFLANDGYICADTSSSQWLAGYVPHTEPAFKALNPPAMHSGSTPGSGLLSPEHLLEVARLIRTRQTQESEHSPPAASATGILLRFTGSLLSPLRSPRETNAQSPRPGLLEFLFVLESAYDRELSKGLVDVTPLTNLWRCTTNIVTWSQVIWGKKRSVIGGGLIYLAGPRFVHIQTPSKVRPMRNMPLPRGARSHPSSGCERHPTKRTIRGWEISSRVRVSNRAHR